MWHVKPAAILRLSPQASLLVVHTGAVPAMKPEATAIGQSARWPLENNQHNSQPVTKGASEPRSAGWQASWSLIGYHGRLASLWLVRQDWDNIKSGSLPSCGIPFWQWSVASPSEMFGWQVRHLDIYLFYVYGSTTVYWRLMLPQMKSCQ